MPIDYDLSKMPREPRHEHQQASFEAGQKAMRAFLEGAPRSSYRTDLIEGMLDAFVREHRTNQQAAVRAFVEMLIMWQKGDAACIADDRNLAALKFARKLAEDDPHFPYI